MSLFEVEAALNHRIDEFSQDFAVRISHENVTFNPRNQTFVKASLEDSRTSVVDLSNSYLRITGTYSVIVYAKPFVGKRDTTDIVRRLQTQYFKRATVIDHNGIQVRLTNFQVFMSSVSDAWYITPMAIGFRSDIPSD